MTATTAPTGTSAGPSMGTATGATAAVRLAARTENGTKVYGSGHTAVRALDAVSIGFADGRFTAIMGASGSGKSTLMHCQAGLDTLSTGQAYIGEVELGSLSDKE